MWQNIPGNFNSKNGVNINDLSKAGGLRKADIEAAGQEAIQNAKDKTKAMQQMQANLSIFKAMDKDHNGSLSLDELNNFFKAADQNGDGNISSEEMRKFVESENFSHIKNEKGEIGKGLGYVANEIGDNGEIKTDKKGVEKTKYEKVKGNDIQRFMDLLLDNNDSNPNIKAVSHNQVDDREATTYVLNDKGDQDIVFEDENTEGKTNYRTIRNEQGLKTTTNYFVDINNKDEAGQAKRIKLDEVEEDSNVKIQTTYDPKMGGENPVPVHKVFNNKATGEICTEDYEQGVVVMRHNKKGVEESIEMFDGVSEKMVERREIIDQGNGLKKTTIATYTKDGEDNINTTVVQDDANQKETICIYKNGAKVSEVVGTPLGTTETEFYADGVTKKQEVIQTTTGQKTIIKYNENGNKSEEYAVDRSKKTTTEKKYADNGNIQQECITEYGDEDFTQPVKQVTTDFVGGKKSKEVSIIDNKSITKIFNKNEQVVSTEEVNQEDNTVTKKAISVSGKEYVESFTDVKNCKTIAKVYNIVNGKTSKTPAYVCLDIQGQKFSVDCDSSGHGRIVVQNGDTFELFVQRTTGLSGEELRSAIKNIKAINGDHMLHPGGKLSVPMEYLTNADVNRASQIFNKNPEYQKALGNISYAQMQERVNNMWRDSHNKVYHDAEISKFGNPKSYEDVAVYLLKQAGYENPKKTHPAVLAEYTKHIKGLNNNIPFEQLGDKMNIRMYKAQLDNYLNQSPMYKSCQQEVTLFHQIITRSEKEIDSLMANQSWQEKVGDYFEHYTSSSGPNLKKKLAHLRDEVYKLRDYLNKPDMPGFKHHYRELFGVDFDLKKVQAWLADPTNATKRAAAIGTKSDYAYLLSDVSKRYAQYIKTDAAFVDAAVAVVTLPVGGSAGVSSRAGRYVMEVASGAAIDLTSEVVNATVFEDRNISAVNVLNIMKDSAYSSVKLKYVGKIAVTTEQIARPIYTDVIDKIAKT